MVCDHFLSAVLADRQAEAHTADKKQWLDDNFIMGCARLEYTGKDTAKVMDTVGGVMYVEYKNGEVRECQK